MQAQDLDLDQLLGHMRSMGMIILTLGIGSDQTSTSMIKSEMEYPSRNGSCAEQCFDSTASGDHA